MIEKVFFAIRSTEGYANSTLTRWYSHSSGVSVFWTTVLDHAVRFDTSQEARDFLDKLNADTSFFCEIVKIHSVKKKP